MNAVTTVPSINNDLFQLSPPHRLYSGALSYWKVGCDALTDEELNWFAKMISVVVEPFGVVEYVPTGARRIGEKVEKYALTGHPTVLIVDDVLTTGNSMESFRRDVQILYPNAKIIGATMFNRSGIHIDWINSIWYMNPIVVENLP